MKASPRAALSLAAAFFLARVLSCEEGLSLRIEAETAIRPASSSIDLDPAFALALAKEGNSKIGIRLPCALRLGEGGFIGALGDLELSAEAQRSRGVNIWSFGIALAVPMGGDPPWEGGAGTRYAQWRAEASVEAARILDPVVAAARASAGMALPRGGTAQGAAYVAGIGLSLAEALNSRVSLGFSASLDGSFDRSEAEFSGDSGMAVSWEGRRASHTIALSQGLGEGAARGPAIVVGVAYRL